MVVIMKLPKIITGGCKPVSRDTNVSRAMIRIAATPPSAADRMTCSEPRKRMTSAVFTK